MVTKHAPDYNKNKTADVIKHGKGRAMPNQQWQMNMNLTPAGSDDSASVLNPRNPRSRPCTHVKKNECDH